MRGGLDGAFLLPKALHGGLDGRRWERRIGGGDVRFVSSGRGGVRSRFKVYDIRSN